jgi:hypothetical protein
MNVTPNKALMDAFAALLGEPTPTDDRWAIGTTWRAKRSGRVVYLVGHRRDGSVVLQRDGELIHRSREKLNRYYVWDVDAGIGPFADFMEVREIPECTGEAIRWNRLSVPEAK